MILMELSLVWVLLESSRKLHLTSCQLTAMRQQVFVELPMTQLKDHFNEIVSAGYSVSLFTDWQSDSINEVWIKDKVNPEIEYHGHGRILWMPGQPKKIFIRSSNFLQKIVHHKWE